MYDLVGLVRAERVLEFGSEEDCGQGGGGYCRAGDCLVASCGLFLFLRGGHERLPELEGSR